MENPKHSAPHGPSPLMHTPLTISGERKRPHVSEQFGSYGPRLRVNPHITLRHHSNPGGIGSCLGPFQET